MLYALVAAGFILVVVVLTIGAAAAGLVPGWWSISLGTACLVVGTWSAFNWRSTGLVLLLGIGLMVAWAIGTLALAS